MHRYAGVPYSPSSACVFNGLRSVGFACVCVQLQTLGARKGQEKGKVCGCAETCSRSSFRSESGQNYSGEPAQRRLTKPLLVFDIAGAGVAGFREWTAHEPLAHRLPRPRSFLQPRPLPRPGYDALNKCWLASSLLVMRGFSRHTGSAVCGYSWDLIAGSTNSMSAAVRGQRLRRCKANSLTTTFGFFCRSRRDLGRLIPKKHLGFVHTSTSSIAWQPMASAFGLLWMLRSIGDSLENPGQQWRSFGRVLNPCSRLTRNWTTGSRFVQPPFARREGLKGLRPSGV